MYKEQKNFKRFIFIYVFIYLFVYLFIYFFHFGHLSIQSVASSISFGVLYSIPQKIPFKWCITCGLLVHGYQFRKTWHFPPG